MYNRAGQTLIESLLAAAVIVIGVVALLAALVNSQVTADISSDEIIAIQLANEPLEGARFIRDSNWLKIEDGQAVEFNDGLHATTDYNGVYQWNPNSTDPDTAISFGFVSGADITNAAAIVYQHSTNGYYRQSTGTLPPAFQATPFRRWVSVYPICYYTDSTPGKQVLTADGQACTDAGRPYVEVGVRIVSQVQWDSRGTTHERVVETELYNWKYADEDVSLSTF